MTTTRDTYTIDFYLKPHLADFARHLVGGERFDIAVTNPIGCMAHHALTHKPEYAKMYQEDFAKDRRRIVGQIGVENARRFGTRSANLLVFENLVEHLFYHSMLVHVDARIAAGVTQNAAIREFLDMNEINLSTVDVMSVKKTIIRRRKRLKRSTTSRK